MEKNKVALITGAGQGIGKEIAFTLSREAMDLVIADINLDQARKVCEEIKQSGKRALPVKVDVGEEESVQKMVEFVLREFKGIDILVNNAGVTRDALLIRMKAEDWDFVLKVNLNGVFKCTKAVLKYMLKQKSGKIINIASIVGLMGNAGQANYAASKGGVIAFTKSIARETAARGINVNAIAPGFIDTEMTRVLPQEVKEKLIAQIPLKRLGSPRDIADCVKFLASEQAGYITGQVIQVNGGMLMG